MYPSRGYEFIEHTGDLKFKSYGKTLSECFENAGYALSESLVDLDSLREKTIIEIELKSENIEYLLHDFLSELLYLFETKDLLVSGYKIEIKENTLNATLKGERYDKTKHLIKCDIKAVTYHDLKVENKNKLWTSEVLCDI